MTLSASQGHFVFSELIERVIAMSLPELAERQLNTIIRPCTLPQGRCLYEKGNGRPTVLINSAGLTYSWSHSAEKTAKIWKLKT